MHYRCSCTWIWLKCGLRALTNANLGWKNMWVFGASATKKAKTHRAVQGKETAKSITAHSSGQRAHTFPIRTMSESPQASNKRFRFHHFDEASEVGLEDPTNGERVRQHKRRGRKPNPPTAEERREQNRAAQRAFREREQAKRMEKEQAWQAMEQEVERLKQRVAQAEYEANYLRGCVLLLSLINLVERGSVPQIYTETRLFPVGQQLMMVSPRGKRDSLHAIPAILQNILDASKHVLSFKDALVTALSNGCAIPTLTMPKDDENSSPKEDENSNTSTSAGHATPGPATTTTTTTTTASAVHAPSSSSSGSKRTRAQTWRSSTPESAATPSTAGTHPSPPSQPDMPGPSIHVERSSVPIRGTLTETPRPKTADDLAHLPALQALHIQRLQLKISSIMGDSARVTLTPST